MCKCAPSSQQSAALGAQRGAHRTFILSAVLSHMHWRTTDAQNKQSGSGTVQRFDLGLESRLMIYLRYSRFGVFFYILITHEHDTFARMLCVKFGESIALSESMRTT